MPTLVTFIVEVLAKTIRQEKEVEGMQVRKEDAQPYLQMTCYYVHKTLTIPPKTCVN